MSCPTFPFALLLACPSVRSLTPPPAVDDDVADAAAAAALGGSVSGTGCRVGVRMLLLLLWLLVDIQRALLKWVFEFLLLGRH